MAVSPFRAGHRPRAKSIGRSARGQGRDANRFGSVACRGRRLPGSRREVRGGPSHWTTRAATIFDIALLSFFGASVHDHRPNCRFDADRSPRHPRDPGNPHGEGPLSRAYSPSSRSSAPSRSAGTVALPATRTPGGSSNFSSTGPSKPASRFTPTHSVAGFPFTILIHRFLARPDLDRRPDDHRRRIRAALPLAHRERDNHRPARPGERPRRPSGVRSDRRRPPGKYDLRRHRVARDLRRDVRLAEGRNGAGDAPCNSMRPPWRRAPGTVQDPTATFLSAFSDSDLPPTTFTGRLARVRMTGPGRCGAPEGRVDRDGGRGRPDDRRPSVRLGLGHQPQLAQGALGVVRNPQDDRVGVRGAPKPVSVRCGGVGRIVRGCAVTPAGSPSARTSMVPVAPSPVTM